MHALNSVYTGPEVSQIPPRVTTHRETYGVLIVKFLAGNESHWKSHCIWQVPVVSDHLVNFFQECVCMHPPRCKLLKNAFIFAFALALQDVTFSRVHWHAHQDVNFSRAHSHSSHAQSTQGIQAHSLLQCLCMSVLLFKLCLYIIRMPICDIV